MIRCAICFYVPETPHEAAEAVTIIRGYAVCEDHLGYVAQGTEWHAILSAARREHSDGSKEG
jgi:hypothetical protein